MDAVQYWDMTFKEIKASIDGYSKRSETDMRINAIIAYQQALLISHQVGIIVGSKEKPKEIYQAFPGIFPHLEQQAEQQAAIQHKKQQDWRIMKERIEAHAAQATEKRKQREVNENSGNNDRAVTNTDNDGNP